MNLNASYPNGPAMKPYHRRGGGGGDCCCCCGCLECLCGCVFNLIFKLILTVIVMLGIVALILWFIFRPHKVAFTVVDASLSKFNFVSVNDTAGKTGSGNIDFDLSLSMDIRNPNNRVSFYYDSMEVRPFYKDQRLRSEMLASFYQGHKNTTSLKVRDQGKSFVKLGGVSEYDKDHRKGVFELELKVYMEVRAKVFWGIKSPKFNAKMQCDLDVPLATNNGTAATPFKRTDCHVHF